MTVVVVPEICGMGIGTSDIEGVTEANLCFYEAFSSLDIQRMEGVWETSERAMCVHPGWRPLTGWEPIRESWESIFENANLMQFNVNNVKVVVEGDCAWVTCLENITSVVEGRANQYAVWATNVFVRAEDGWRMVHHHASG